MTEQFEKQWESTLKARHGVDIAEIREVMHGARSVLAGANIDRIQSMLDASLQFFLVGERVTAMWAAQAAWEAATWVRYAVQDHPLHKTKWATQAGGKKGVARKGSPKRDRVIAAVKAYKGETRDMASKIANKVGCDSGYVRKVAKELKRTTLP